MPSPILTLLLFVDAEKEPAMTARFMASLRELNGDGLRDTQVIAVIQPGTAREQVTAIADQPYPVDVVYARQDIVDGYPVWDVMDATRRIWGMIKGEYITYAHPEFFLCPDRLERTCNALRANRPWLALGNLRRPAHDRDECRKASCSERVSRELSVAIDAGDWNYVRGLCECMPTLHWVYWAMEPKRDETVWREDIFFASKQWLEVVGFNRDVGPMPFQDVYDIVGAIVDQLAKRKLEPKVLRLLSDEHMAIHLWHKKQYGGMTKTMQEHFLSQPERYADTRFLDVDLWRDLVAVSNGADFPKNKKPIRNLRRGPGGTVTRFAVATSEYLREGGTETLYEFYSKYGRGRKVV